MKFYEVIEIKLSDPDHQVVLCAFDDETEAENQAFKLNVKMLMADREYIVNEREVKIK